MRCHHEVVAKDTLSEVVSTYRSAFVCNTYDGDQPGEHWVTMYVDEIGDYFDPCEKNPQHAEFTNIMIEHFSQWSSNDIEPYIFRLFTTDLNFIANDCRVFDWLGTLNKRNDEKHLVFVSYVNDVNNIYFYPLYVHFPDTQTPILENNGVDCCSLISTLRW